MTTIMTTIMIHNDKMTTIFIIKFGRGQTKTVGEVAF